MALATVTLKSLHEIDGGKFGAAFEHELGVANSLPSPRMTPRLSGSPSTTEPPDRLRARRSDGSCD